MANISKGHSEIWGVGSLFASCAVAAGLTVALKSGHGPGFSGAILPPLLFICGLAFPALMLIPRLHRPADVGFEVVPARSDTRLLPVMTRGARPSLSCSAAPKPATTCGVPR